MIFNTPQDIFSFLKKINTEFQKSIVGQDDLRNALILTLLSGGHMLIEGLPGLAKTRAVNTLAKICQTTFQRVQFTPDLLPADLIGTQMYNVQEGKFSIKKGPLFSHFILADEINRAPAKVQSALLEAMQEKQITIADQTFILPKPFFVFATQNSIEHEGTYPLPEAQLDRFLIKLILSYPEPEEEKQIISMVLQETGLPNIEPLMTPEIILELQKQTRRVFIDDQVIEYITRLSFATRRPADYDMPNLKEIIAVGVSPRASLALAVVGQAKALLMERDYVIPEDIKSIAPMVLRHRLIPSYYAQAEKITSDQIIAEILRKTRVP